MKHPNPDNGASENGAVRRRIILAEDDAAFRRFLVDALSVEGFEVIAAKNGLELLDLLNFAAYPDQGLTPFDAVVTDFHLPGLTGLEVLEGLAVAGAAGRVIVISGFADEATMRWARSIGASATLAKPFQIDELVAALEEAMEHELDAPSLAAANSEQA
ncbi:response regulator [Haliangium ochraceum]|uniref:Response regulator receiver protein n=1 Tax=Haliangium ochraceum (strain DSM 14365 / JCM 11303 / SMP-2) TaxID=502025 RepID=D0LXZ5_HALO1|nr:response regulator [Haliangium ochraceum]ACY14350.1 response regulator receiver protein [Haliangium ochraceum DSM 14365]